MFIWTLLIGETLAAGVEEENEHNHYAVAVRKGGIIVGHILYTRELPGPFTTSSDMVAPLNVRTNWTQKVWRWLGSSMRLHAF